MAILDRYAGFIVDLDGAIDRTGDVPRETITFLRRARRAHKSVAFVTDDTTLTPAEVADRFGDRRAGVGADQVVTSATAAAVLLAPSGVKTLAIGATALSTTLRDGGVELVHESESAGAVVAGWSPDLQMASFHRATVAIREGARFVGTSRDATVEHEGDRWPGPGAVLAMLHNATGVAPEMAGKPQATMFELAAARLDVDGPILVVGAGWDTDLAAASKLGWEAALLASDPSSVGRIAEAAMAPRWVIPHLGSLVGDEPAIVRRAREADLSSIMDLLERAGFESEPAASRLKATLVAEGPDGGVTGVIAWEMVDNAAHLRGITVTASERGHGTASHLVARALLALRDANVEYVYLLTPGAESLFERLGFWRVHRDRVPKRILETAMYGEPSKGGIALVRRLD